MKFIIKLLTTVMIMLASLSSYAWNSLAHMTIATIAYQYLNASTLANVNKYVNLFSQEYPDMSTFVMMATWMDKERSMGVDAYTRWHYNLHAFSSDGTPTMNTIADDNGIWMLNESENTLKTSTVNPYDRARVLAMIENIAGDMHQVLYTSNLFSKNFPQGSNGGAAYFINYNGKRIDLQSFWDRGLGLFSASPTPQNAQTLANSITALYPPSFFGSNINDIIPGNWANEGYEYAPKYVYTIAANTTPSQAYITAGQTLCQQRLALSGYRLAAFLNSLI